MESRASGLHAAVGRFPDGLDDAYTLLLIDKIIRSGIRTISSQPYGVRRLCRWLPM